MPQIAISEGLFTRLQAHAVPLVDSIESVISRAVDSLDSAASNDTQANNKVVTFNGLNPPNLAYAKLTRVVLNGEVLPQAVIYWNNLMFRVIRYAALHAPAAQSLITVNSVQGSKDVSGFQYIQELGISVQGQNSNKAWDQIASIADKLKLPLEVEFVWEDKEKAAMPNVTGRFVMNIA